MSVYDITDHPDFRFRTTDFVIRIGNAEDGAASIGENEVSHVCVWGLMLQSCDWVREVQVSVRTVVLRILQQLP